MKWDAKKRSPAYMSIPEGSKVGIHYIWGIPMKTQDVLFSLKPNLSMIVNFTLIEGIQKLVAILLRLLGLCKNIVSVLLIKNISLSQN